MIIIGQEGLTNTAIFGNSFLRGSKMIFDYDTNKIGFFPQVEIRYYVNHWFLVLGLFVFAVFMLVFSVYINLIDKKRINYDSLAASNLPI